MTPEKLLKAAFPGIRTISITNHPAPQAGFSRRSSMTEQTAAPGAEDMDWSDVEGEADNVSYPERPDNPHNHRFTISLDGRGPMIVARGNTAAEINAAFQELMNAGTPALLSTVYAQIKGGSAPAPQAPQMPPQGGFQAPPQQQFPQPAQQFPGHAGTAPAAWQNAGAAPNLPQGWYRLDVPFKQKPQFDAIVTQYSLRKGDPDRGGQVSFQKVTKSWYCSPEVAGAFPMFNPVPA